MTKLLLKHPLPNVDGDSIKELTFRDILTAGDYLHQDEFGHHAQKQQLIAYLTGQNVAVIKKLRGPDYQAAIKKADAMLANTALAAKKIRVSEGSDFRLAVPIAIGDGSRTIDSLKFRDYTTAEDYRAFDIPGEALSTLTLIASMAGTDIALINKMSGEDYLVAVRKIDKLLDNDTGFDAPENVDMSEITDPKKPV